MGVKGYAIHLSFSTGNAVLMRDKLPKSTRTQGGDTIADYIMADTPLPLFLPYPRFLLKMEISQTAKLLYSLLLDRSTLSQKNKWQDDKGRIYIIYPIAEIAEILDKGSTTIRADFPVLPNLRGCCPASLWAAKGGQYPAGTAICRIGGDPEAGLWKTQPHLPKIL